MPLLMCICFSGTAQIYQHDFGSTTISTHPYTVAPTMIDSHLSGSSWTNTANAWTSATGSAGQAIRLTTATAATITLTLQVAANFQMQLNSFGFWTQRSAAGPQNWTLSVNGTSVGSGIVPTIGASTGTIPVSTTISGVTGTVQITLSLSGNTGNGTFRLDDFTLNGSVTSNCSGATVSSIFPVSGPQNTLVTISGSGFTSGSGTSQVAFNGIASSFTVVSDTEIKAYVPAGNTIGPISVTTNGCQGFSAQNFTQIASNATQNYSSDIYISELYDAQAGDGGVIELYNGTNATVNLNGYSIRRYGDVGGTTFYTINLVGSMPAGSIFLIGIGTGTIPCNITGNQYYSTGFNANDEFRLYNNGVWIDDVQAPQNVGYSVIRKPNVVAPLPTFNPSHWDTFTTENCADIGQHDVQQNIPPTPTSPLSVSTCENAQAAFSVNALPGGFTYQWKKLDAAGNWVNVPNTSPFSGGQTTTLTISPVPAGFDESQYYCQMTSAGSSVVSHAAQMTVTPALTPDFQTSLVICSGDVVPTLANVSPNGITGTWNPTVISNTASGSYIFTPNAGQCASAVTLNVSVTNSIVPDFATSLTICQNDVVPTLNSVSPNGITGSWNPSTISNTANGSYIFTPNAGQCASSVTLNVLVTNPIVPDFVTSLTICQNDAVPTLNSVSPNGITGSWNPSTISNTASGSYIFTPNAGQCASAVTLNVSVTNSIVPDFATSLTICQNDAVPTLANVSPNGVSGSWNPSTISNTASGSYIFTPNAGQCASAVTLNVSVTNSIVPDFVTSLTICENDAVPTLNSVSPNGITGSWNPSTISNTASGSYIFTPNAGQCASAVTLSVSVTNPIVPNFATSLTICENDAVPTLANVSPNGVSGSWNPSVISNIASGTYIFTPNAGQCASAVTLNVSVTNSIVPNFATSLAICQNDTVPTLNSVSPNGVSGSWNPTVISNTASGSYVFTPNAGQCASAVTLTVSVTNSIVPDFSTSLAICQNDVSPTLVNVSPNGISGSWNPSVISNTTSGSYIFTPNAGQCASAVTLNVSVTNSIVPDFVTSLAICQNDAVPTLVNVSPNGVSGSWNPSVISNTANGSYVFTPNAGQCALTVTLNVSVTNSIVPDFATSLTICQNDAAPTLANVSPNGVSGSWNPSVISNTASGSYVFTPNAGQCATSVLLTVTVNPLPTPVLHDTLLCADNPSGVLLDTGLPASGYAFQWSLDGNPLTTTTPAHLAMTQGIYSVTVENVVSGCMSSAQATVTEYGGITITAQVPRDFEGHGNVHILVTGGSGNFSYLLDGEQLQLNDGYFDGLDSGEHMVEVRDIDGCAIGSVSFFILYYPRYFTPNGDGFHDAWTISGLPNPGARVYIFDRYGKLLKEMDPSTTTGWDGTFNGRELPSTDYWFKLNYTDRSGKKKDFSAHFSLKR
ncbi:T9SS type B sorting domain-containing protein [Flavobacterium sp. MAH-1]|uniref:T9SS type B sorting domain-containing protein n=1 Tax=Flavobacterium agri TaxID=2743471 RepID=A0A7Y9C3X0_9FLAO|nr:T9SS type B sorting domain-containing protein [Flavobacterium agri]NUY79276.1 T9SS type B sorting domain-containing protein [Flavobacterium agri]NYA69300.1 T9SS type B sorting domain-containing protein [Flavobacterium agri]